MFVVPSEPPGRLFLQQYQVGGVRVRVPEERREGEGTAGDEMGGSSLDGRRTFALFASKLEKLDPQDPWAGWGYALARKIRMSLERTE
jgi:hypothetical protein